MEDIERLSKDANLAYYEMVNSHKYQPLTKVSGNSHGTRTCIKRKKIDYGKLFDFCADKYIYIKGFQKMKIRPLKGFEKMRFLCFYIIAV